VPLDAFGSGPEGLVRRTQQAKNRESGIGKAGKHLGQAGALGVVTVLVPPAVLDEVEAVFHLPMAADVGVQLPRT